MYVISKDGLVVVLVKMVKVHSPDVNFNNTHVHMRIH
jgi:hypothetical protein